jgi:hypothetical protein
LSRPERSCNGTTSTEACWEVPRESNQEGSLRIHSDQDVIAWVSQINNVSQDPDFFVAGSAQATRLLIPSAVSVGRYHSTLYW